MAGTGTGTCPTGTNRSLMTMMGGGCSELDEFEEVEVGAVLVGWVLPASTSAMAVMAGLFVLSPPPLSELGRGGYGRTVRGGAPPRCSVVLRGVRSRFSISVLSAWR